MNYTIPPPPQTSLRPGRNRERVEELVRTEKDYIGDLEVLLRVINETISSSGWGEGAGLHLRPLLGNVVQVRRTLIKNTALS